MSDVDPDIASAVSLRRLQTLTDSIFALALILVVALIDKPPLDMEPTEENIRGYLLGQSHTLLAYLVTFINISFYWFFNHNQSRHFRRSDSIHVWLTLVTLMLVGLLPYCNGLVVAFEESLTAHLFFSATVFVLGLFFCIDWLHATRRDRLVDRSMAPGTVEQLIVESLVQPSAALLSIGGAFIGTFWWQLPFLLTPFATIGIGRLWMKRRALKSA